MNALIKANKHFDMLMMPGEEHGSGRRGPSAPYDDRKVWDFFLRSLLGAKTNDWNQMSSPDIVSDQNDARPRRRYRRWTCFRRAEHKR